MILRLFKHSLILIVFCFAVACSYKPILDDNWKYNNTSEKNIDLDIEECEKKASKHLDRYKAKRAAKEGVRKGVIGSVFGTITGFIFGGNTVSTLTGAGIGAGVGAATGALSVAGEGKVTPDQIKQRYITKCLSQKGYEVLGWQ